MKIRSGFVSNSSSSSFVVAGNEPPQCTITIDVPYQKVITNEEDLLAYFLDRDGQYEWYEFNDEKAIYESEVADEYLACRKALEEGKKLYFGTVSSDEPETAYLYDNGMSGGNYDIIKEH